MTGSPIGTGTFTPRPGAAPLPRMVLAQAGMESRLMLRNGEQLLLAVVIPVIVLVGGITGADRFDLTSRTPGRLPHPGRAGAGDHVDRFTSLAIATGFERRYGVLKRLGSSPLPRSGLLAGKVGALLLVELLQFLVICAAALALGWCPGTAEGLLGLRCSPSLLGTAAFASLGLFVAGALRAEATLAVANLVYLLLLAGGAVVFPAGSYGSAGEALAFLPSAALGDAMRSSLLGDGFPAVPLLVLVAWTVLGTVLTARTFSWE